MHRDRGDSQNGKQQALLQTEQRVANLLFQGTDQHRSNVDDIITRFAAALEDNGDTSFVHLCDGVGGKPSKEYKKEHPVVGSYVYVPDRRTPGKGEKHPRKAIPSALQRELGSYLGDGIEDNLTEAAQYILQLQRLGKMPDIVNLTGFSRGAYTALLTARMLYSMYPDLKVNLFLIEPVPGPGFTDKSMASAIMPNVERATIVLQQDEKRPEFSPFDQNSLKIMEPRHTHVVWETLPGGHSAATAFKSEDTSDVVRLTNALMYQQAKASGSRFKNDSPPAYIGNPAFIPKPNNVRSLPNEDLTEPGQLALYHGMQNNRDAYRKVADQRNRRIYSRKRSFTKSMDAYVLDADFFVSQRHRELFRKYLPRTFDYLFRSNQLNSDWIRLAKELHKFQNRYPTVFQALIPALHQKEVYFEKLIEPIRKNHADFNGLEIPSGIFPATPSGSRQYERHYVLKDKPYTEDGLSHLLYRVNAVMDNFLKKSGDENSLGIVKTLKKDIQDILKQNINQLHKERRIRHLTKQAIQGLRDQRADKKVIHHLENVLDDASSLKGKIKRVLAQHETLLKQYAEIHQEKVHQKPLLSMMKAFKEKIDSFNTDRSLNDKQKKEAMLGQLQRFIPKLFYSNVSKSTTEGLRNSFYRLLMEQQGNTHRKVDHLIKHAEAYIFRAKVKSVLNKVLNLVGFGSIARSALRNERITAMRHFTDNLKSLTTKQGGTYKDLRAHLNTTLHDLADIQKRHNKISGGEGTRMIQSALEDLGLSAQKTGVNHPSRSSTKTYKRTYEHAKKCHHEKGTKSDDTKSKSNKASNEWKCC